LKVLKEMHLKDTTLFSELGASEAVRLDVRLLARKIKGKILVGKQPANNLLIAFPARDRLMSHLDANHDYVVTDGAKGKNDITLTEEIALAHRHNTVSQKVEFWPGSCYPFRETCVRSSILGARREIYAKTASLASHSFTQTHKKDGKIIPCGMDPVAFKFSDQFKEGEPANATEVLLLFIAEFAQCFVPIDQGPFSALWALEDAVHAPLSAERKTMESLLKSLQELRQLAPTHFHDDIYSLQHEIIRAKLPKCTRDFSDIAKSKKRKQRDPQPQPGATWPVAGQAKAKRVTRPIKALTAKMRDVTFETSAKTDSFSTPKPELEQQLAQAQQMVLQPQQEKQAVAAQQQNPAVAAQQQIEAAPPSSNSIPKTQENEQGGAIPVVETEEQ
jgi:hypothetical protein